MLLACLKFAVSADRLTDDDDRGRGQESELHARRTNPRRKQQQQRIVSLYIQQGDPCRQEVNSNKQRSTHPSTAVVKWAAKQS